MTTHFFTAVFPPMDHFFEESAVETGDEFSTIYIFMTLFVNNVYFKVSIMFLISFFIVKKRNKLSRNHIFNFFLFLRNEIKLMIILLDFVSPLRNTHSRLGTTIKILNFVVKKRRTASVQLWKFIFPCKKTNGHLGTHIGQLTYCIANFLSSNFVSIATLNCNFLFFFFYHFLFIIFIGGFDEDWLFFNSFFNNKPLIWGSCCGVWWRFFYNLYSYYHFGEWCIFKV